MSAETAPEDVPLARHLLFHTTDLLRAEQAGTLAMSAHHLRASARERFYTSFHAASIGSSHVIFHIQGGEVELRTEAPLEYYTLHSVVAGELEILTDGRTVQLGPGQACVLSPGGGGVTMRWASGSRQLAAKIPRPTMAETHGRLTGRPGGEQIQFQLPAPFDAAWPAILELAVQSIDRAGSALSVTGQFGSELERMIVTSLVLGHPHDAVDGALEPMASRGYMAAGLVARVLREAPQRSVDFGELSRTAGVGLRTLQAGFAVRYGRSPTQYLHDLRLSHAFGLLSAGAVATVTEAAVLSGFTHLGRFSRDYRRRFGVAPSDTLHHGGAFSG